MNKLNVNKLKLKVDVQNEFSEISHKEMREHTASLKMRDVVQERDRILLKHLHPKFIAQQ